jgi:hypothetical protein
MTMADLNPDDRYQLRKLQMDVDKKELEVQKAKQEVDRFILELEHKYDLMTQSRSLTQGPGRSRVRQDVMGKDVLKNCLQPGRERQPRKPETRTSVSVMWRRGVAPIDDRPRHHRYTEHTDPSLGENAPAT